MPRRKHFKQSLDLKDRLASFIKRVQEQASQAPPGAERNALLKKVSQAETAARMEEWASSPELQPPK
jgi:hypothetical protein